ncbi:MAG TPA: alpha-hydroxy-acid oxidizing enzyme, partial [Chloroflexi bacterium]|nr:alpha-hydroxy-acid oxidizing enzyme [Chloroflexota bacterium]
MRFSDVRQLVQIKPPMISRQRRVLANAYNVAEYRAAARRALPSGIFDYLDGGAEDEVTLRHNRAAFDNWG